MTLKELRLWHMFNAFLANGNTTEGCDCPNCARLNSIATFHLDAAAAMSAVVDGDPYADLEVKLAAAGASNPEPSIMVPINKTVH